MSLSRFVFASATYDHWFFAAGDLATLKALLDRAAHQGDNSETSLQDDSSFAAAQKHLPADFAGMLFLNPQPFVEKLLPLITMTGQSIPPHQLEVLKSIRSVTGAVGFDHGKMRETDFVAMPRVGQDEKLARPLLGAAGTDTFFYSTSQMQWPNEIVSPTSVTSGGFSTLLDQLSAGFRAHGVAMDICRWRLATTSRASAIGRQNAHWPDYIATAPVNDPPQGSEDRGAR